MEKVFAEGDNHGVGTQIREVWTTDKRQQLAQFKVDQDRNGEYLEAKHDTYISVLVKYCVLVTGKRSNQWSMITIRIGMFDIAVIS